MATSWDIESSDGPDLQRSGGPIKAMAGTVTKAAMFVSVLLASDAIMTPVQAAYVSSPVVAVRQVTRTAPKTTRTRKRTDNLDEFAADADGGLSSRRLADTFALLFNPIDEDSEDVDYTFS
jgi:hypothetical protein